MKKRNQIIAAFLAATNDNYTGNINICKGSKGWKF